MFLADFDVFHNFNVYLVHVYVKLPHTYPSTQNQDYFFDKIYDYFMKHTHTISFQDVIVA